MAEIRNESELRKYVREFLMNRRNGGSGLVKEKSKFSSDTESFLDLHNAIKKGDYLDPDKKSEVEKIIEKAKSDLASLIDEMGKVRKD